MPLVWCIEVVDEALSSNWEDISALTHFRLQKRVVPYADMFTPQTFKTKTCGDCEALFFPGICPTCADLRYSYRIIFLCSDTMTVSKSTNKDLIEAIWHHISTDIQPMLQLLEIENEKKHQNQNTRTNSLEPPPISFFKRFRTRKASAPEPETKKTQKCDPLYDFFVPKVAAHIRADSSFQESELNEGYFFKQFPSISKQTIKLWERCGLFSHRYCYGMLCVTQQHFYFVDASTRDPFSVPLNSFHSVSINSEASFLCGISCQVGGGDTTMSIIGLPSPSKFFVQFQELVKSSLHRSLSDQQDDRYSDLQNVPLRRRRRRMSNNPMLLKRRVSESRKLPASRRNAKLRSSISSLNACIEQEENLRDKELFQEAECWPIFTNPTLETLLALPATLFRQKVAPNTSRKVRRGILEISYQTLHFCSTDGIFVVVTLPFKDIKKIAMVSMGTVKIILKSKLSRNIYLTVEDPEVANEICQLVQVSKGNSVEDDFSEDSFWDLKQQIFKNILPEDKDIVKQWEAYFQLYGDGSTVIRASCLVQLILMGIPNQFRTMMWQVISGSYYYALDEGIPYSYYLQQVHEAIRPNNTSTDIAIEKFRFCYEDIQKDVNRSCPSHPFYERNGPGVKSLSNILCAFAWRNPVIGYCQGMNIVASVFLLFLNERETFFLLCSLVEDILPDYYSKSMIGSLVDVKVFEILLEKYAPKIFSTITQSGSVSAIVVPWFMCLFIGTLPWSLILQAIDLVLSRGSISLFVIALSIFSSCKKEILNKDSEYVFEFMHNEMKDAIQPKVLQHYIRFYFTVISEAEISHLREIQKPIIIEEILLFDEETLQSSEDECCTKISEDTFEQRMKENQTALIATQHKELILKQGELGESSVSRRKRNRELAVDNTKLPNFSRLLKADTSDTINPCNPVAPRSPRSSAIEGMAEFILK